MRDGRGSCEDAIKVYKAVVEVGGLYIPMPPRCTQSPMGLLAVMFHPPLNGVGIAVEVGVEFGNRSRLTCCQVHSNLAMRNQ